MHREDEGAFGDGEPVVVWRRLEETSKDLELTRDRGRVVVFGGFSDGDVQGDIFFDIDRLIGRYSSACICSNPRRDTYRA